jgi:hypothetical protein
LRSRFNRAAAEVAQVLNNFAPPRLAVQFYLPRLLKFGDALLQANAYYIAQKQCYERFIEVRPAPTNLHAACARVWLLRAERLPLPKSWLRSGRPGHSQLPHLPAPARVCAGTAAKGLVPTYSNMCGVGSCVPEAAAVHSPPHRAGGVGRSGRRSTFKRVEWSNAHVSYSHRPAMAHARRAVLVRRCCHRGRQRRTQSGCTRVRRLEGSGACSGCLDVSLSCMTVRMLFRP